MLGNSQIIALSMWQHGQVEAPQASAFSGLNPNRCHDESADTYGAFSVYASHRILSTIGR
jgi:hypothetical protein